MTHELKEKNELPAYRQRWFWVALLFLGYQAGIFLFLKQEILSELEDMSSDMIVFYGITAISVVISLASFLKRDLFVSHRWKIISASSILGTVFSASSLGTDGISTLAYSYIGIPIAYQIIATLFIDGRNDPEFFIGAGTTIVTFLLWLVLVLKAPVLRERSIRWMGTIFIISVLCAIGGCAVLGGTDFGG
jgi:hypothetical protein